MRINLTRSPLSTLFFKKCIFLINTHDKTVLKKSLEMIEKLLVYLQQFANILQYINIIQFSTEIDLFDFINKQILSFKKDSRNLKMW